MAKKTLGYVELEWVCPTCNTKNPGSSRTCQGCGAPQPPDVKFVAPGQATVTKDETVARKATAGPDIHCPYCDARNPATAKVCKQCGGDLTKGEARKAGEVVSNFSTTGPGVVKCTTCGTENPSNLRTCKNCGAPLPVVKPAVAPVPQAAGGNSCLLIGIGAAVLLVIGVVIFFMMSGGERTTAVGTVVDNRWVRTIEVMGLRPRAYTAWLDQIPADATIGACTDEVRTEVDEPVANSREVCGTPYAVDQGTGFAEVVQDCLYQIIEQQCEYTVNEWQPVDVISEEGTGFTPSWPALTGRQREGEREEQYQCIFTINDVNYVYQMRSFEEYQSCQPGSQWNLTTNESGQVLSAVPVE
jgi:ribosomal protein L40E